MLTTDKIHYPSLPPEDGQDVLWRAECRSYAYCVNADYDEWATTSPRLEVRWYRVIRRTPCGARLETGKFVNLRNHVKEWASETAEEAIRHLKARRKKQIRILSAQMASAKEELRIAEVCLQQVATSV